MEQHSKHYELVRKYYKAHVWTTKHVVDALQKNWITREEFKEITGQEPPLDE